MKTIRLIAGLGTLAISALAVAQVHGGSAREHGGDLTRAQAVERADQMFQRSDLNRDGKATRAEGEQGHRQMEAEMPAGHAGRRAHGSEGSAKGRLDFVFGKRNSATAAEFRQRHLALFAQLDRNGDGVIAGAEHEQARMKH